MKMRLLVPAVAAGVLGASPAHAQNVTVIVASDVRPGIYGRVEIGTAPPPPVVYAQPRVIVVQPQPVQPIYMHVPPGHAKKWDKHCKKYNACNVPVYFVRSREYEPGYQAEDKGKGKGKGWAKGHDKKD